MKKFKLLAFICLFTIILNGCADNKTATKLQPIEDKVEIPAPTKLKEKEAPKKNFSEAEIAKYAIAAIMGRPPETMKVIDKYRTYHVSYIRKSDKKKFHYKVEIEGDDKIIWAMDKGRWRTGVYDDVINFYEKGNTLTIVQKFSDGSKSVKEFTKK